MKENALKRVQLVLDTIQSFDKKEAEKIYEVNSFLIRKDIRHLPDEKKEELSSTIEKWYFSEQIDSKKIKNLRVQDPTHLFRYHLNSTNFNFD